MITMLRKPKGQTALEYAVLIAVTIAALVGMRVYMKHSYEGKLRSSIDDVGKQSDISGLEVDITRNTSGKTIELSEFGESNSSTTQETTLIQSSKERVLPYSADESIW